MIDINTIREDYIPKKLIRECKDGDLSLFCYTKKAFYDVEWDQYTIACRGLLAYKDRIVNKPFPKFFNIGEGDIDYAYVYNLMSKYDYIVQDKANGHLVILTSFIDDEGERQTILTTKGSLDSEENEMLRLDREIFNTKYKARFDSWVQPNVEYTLMFEVIAEHDKHALYDTMVKRYGNNTFVLLGGYTRLRGYEWTPIIRPWYKWGDIGIPHVKKDSCYPAGHIINVDELYNHVGCEGYVLWFPEADERIKIKTRDYWKVRAAFKSEMEADSIIKMLRSGGFDRLRMRLPEEIVGNVINTIEQFLIDYYDDFIYTHVYDSNENIERKPTQVFTRGFYSTIQDSYIDEAMLIEDKRYTLHSILKSKKNRRILVDIICESDYHYNELHKRLSNSF